LDNEIVESEFLLNEAFGPNQITPTVEGSNRFGDKRSLFQQGNGSGMILVNIQESPIDLMVLVRGDREILN